MAKNAGLINSQYYMNKKKFSVFQTRENEWIKNVLIEWKYDVGTVKELLRKDYQKVTPQTKAKNTRV
ncbi:hypothetical protein H5P36_22005 [Bacillus sp. APMAM]|nr:hypothetical protein [Bacillus sp. APMAM]